MLDSTEFLIGLAIREIGELAGLGVSRREIARRTGLGQSTVYGILRGQHGIGRSRAEQVVAAQITKRWVTIAQPDGSQVRGTPATGSDAARIGKYGNAVKRALSGDPSALADPDFRRPVTLITRDGQRVRVRLGTDPDWIAEMGEREEDIVDFSESESP